jgi:group I intron endonuclease
MSDTWILYQTTNLVNGKIYVGVHKVQDTWQSKNYLGSGDNIKRAIEKYGRESFVRETLAQFDCCENAYAAEAKMVTEDFLKRGDTYNICLGGRGGVNLTEEMKRKISATVKKNNFMRGKRHTPESIAKMSAAQKGKVLSAETKAKLSAINKGNTYACGCVRSEEYKANKRDALLGKANPAKYTPIIINGRYYISVKEAAKLEEVKYNTVQSRVKSTHPNWSKWRYATEEDTANFLTMGVAED